MQIRPTRMTTRKIAADVVADAEQMLETMEEDEGFDDHARIIRWLLPDARRTLAELRSGKKYEWDAPQMLPVHTIGILMDHMDRIVLDAIDDLSDEEYEQLMEQMEKES
ncbi:MAG: hypothetical protein M9953_02860 [Thermomicrobiales bacterium]|nr:hypothetical protein [Thermomicrobiales bacterium]MCO5224256.1 hypothetical protein [Thermomicrobiales bacterium]